MRLVAAGIVLWLPSADKGVEKRGGSTDLFLAVGGKNRDDSSVIISQLSPGNSGHWLRVSEIDRKQRENSIRVGGEMRVDLYRRRDGSHQFACRLL